MVRYNRMSGKTYGEGHSLWDALFATPFGLAAGFFLFGRFRRRPCQRYAASVSPSKPFRTARRMARDVVVADGALQEINVLFSMMMFLARSIMVSLYMRKEVPCQLKNQRLRL